MQATRCGTNPRISLIEWTVPLAVSVSVAFPVPRLPFFLQLKSWLCTVYTPSWSISTAWHLVCGMIECCTKCSLFYCFESQTKTFIVRCALITPVVLPSCCIRGLISKDSGIDGQCSAYLIPFATVHEVFLEPTLDILDQ